MKNVSGFLPYERWQHIVKRRTIVRLEKTLRMFAHNPHFWHAQWHDILAWREESYFLVEGACRAAMQLILRSFWSYFTESASWKKALTRLPFPFERRARRRCLSVWEKWRDSRMRGEREKTLSAFFPFPFSLKWGERACELSARRPPPARLPRNEC